MRFSPITIALVYCAMGVIFVFFAIDVVGRSGWNVWAFLLIAFAAFDFLVAIRYFQLRHAIKKMRDQNKKHDD
ncbi:YdiK family protein [Alkalihalobacillus trypoxylicola]|uniref:DUF4305 domain-containing protein n=1 Tax=Alkalihalobacillus trypoxylicola TaxID=519424 RepID=A0A161PHC7_9BACI|nr:YdiK family protein [Alkalihalobacillus trypoxylicola]KYG33011.1 hypothetical protein AZF04_17785 [Alkalihalobacillus trypoxylicola]GAF66686.1 hypothetical protein BTS2_3588 [Bacillus sp. TS-2]